MDENATTLVTVKEYAHLTGQHVNSVWRAVREGRYGDRVERTGSRGVRIKVNSALAADRLASLEAKVRALEEKVRALENADA